jgi:hypothetical protein
MKVGVKANVTLQEFPGQKFLGTIARTADAIDPATRTLNTEVDVPNKDGKLLPGSFGQVHFATGTSVQRITIPVNAMLFRAEGRGSRSSTRMAKCTCARSTLDATSALRSRFWRARCSDQIVINPSDSLEEGQQVHVAKPSTGDALVKRWPSECGEWRRRRGEPRLYRRRGLTTAVVAGVACCLLWDAPWGLDISGPLRWFPIRGKAKGPGRRPLPRMQFPRARGGRFFTTRNSISWSRNCFRRTSR